MNLNPATVLDPVFHFLDGIIADYGLYLFLAFVWLSLVLLAWVFSGGLRRKFPRSTARSCQHPHCHTTTHTTIVPAADYHPRI